MESRPMRVSRSLRGCLMLLEYIAGRPSVVAPLFCVAIDHKMSDGRIVRIFYKGCGIAGDVWGLEMQNAKFMQRGEADAAALRLEASVVAVPDWMAY